MKHLLILLCLLAFVVPVFAQDATQEATAAATMSEEYTVNLMSSPLGDIMVGPNGMTLYTFDPDTLDTSNCTGKCLEFWPALTVPSAADLTADESIPGDWGTITRADDGTIQVTYNGQPLYYFAYDKAPGDINGEGVTNNWWVVKPATVYISRSKDNGTFLVGPKGMTLYMFTNDTAGSPSTCTGQCATNWPALTVADDEAPIVAGDNVHGKLGTVTNADGSYQVTYNGWPLYYFAKDAKRGDVMGEGVGNKWYTIAPETVVVAAGSGDVSNYLVAGLGGKTLYTFKNDTADATTSACTGDCAKAWPPFTVAANTKLVGGDGATGKLGTITRDDGKLQVTYNGWPLYYYSKDAKAGDTTGQGVGDKWYVAAAS